MHSKIKYFLYASSLLIGTFLTDTHSADNRAAAIIGEQIITYQQIEDPIASDIYDAELKLYQLKLNQLRNQILMRLIEKSPLSKGLSSDAFVQKYVTRSKPISDIEVDQFILEKRIPAEKVNLELRANAKQYMAQQRATAAMKQWIQDEGKKHGLKINLTAPKKPRYEIAINGAPIQGPDDAPITIVEYSDFQCPYCARAEKTIKEIQKNYQGKVKVVYKQFPLDFHKDAFRASEASLCANEQSTELFWKLHDYMLVNPRELSEENLITQAVKIGAKEKRFSQCLKSGKYVNKVQQEMEEGRQVGVQSTPMFFVNGIIVKGAQPYSVFKELIDEELQDSSTSM